MHFGVVSVWIQDTTYQEWAELVSKSADPIITELRSQIHKLKSRIHSSEKFSLFLHLQRGSEVRKHLKSGFFEDRILNGPVFKWLGFSYGYSYSPNHLKTGPFEIQTFLSGFQMVFDKMAAICLDFKWLGFRISDSIQNPDHLQPNLFSTIQNPD